MTDNEIIKALEFCEEHKDNCYACPVSDDCISKNMPFIGWALSLINRQKAEIEMLKGWERLLKAEIHAPIKAKARAEAIKEFAERLKKVYDGYEIFGRGVAKGEIDCLVKEMVGEDK